MRIFRWILAFCVFLVASYYIWGYTGKDYSDLPVSQAAIILQGYGKDVHKGNVVAIQPYLAAADFCNGQHFYNALNRYFKQAQDSGWLQPNTVAVLPENIGSWLAFAEEKKTVYQEDSMRAAVATIVNSNIFNFIRHLMRTPPDDKIKHAFVYMKSDAMVRIYTSVFSTLAKKFNISIAAGSIILPNPLLDKRGRIRTRKGQLYYAAFVFNPKGLIESAPALRKLPEYDSGSNAPVTDTTRFVAVSLPAGAMSITTSEGVKGSASLTSLQRARLRLFLGGQDRIWNAVWKGPGGFAIPAAAVQAPDDTLAVSRYLASNREAGLTTNPIENGNAKGSLLINGFNGQLWEIPFRNGLVASYPYSPEFPGTLPLRFEALRQQGRIINLWFR